MIDVKWQYLLLVAVFIAAIALSLWTATRVDMRDIEQSLTNVSEEEHEGVIEGGNVPLYIGIVVALFSSLSLLFVYLSNIDEDGDRPSSGDSPTMTKNELCSILGLSCVKKIR